MLKGLLYPLEVSTEYQALLNGIHKNLRQQLIVGITGSQSAYYIAGVAAKQSGPILAVVHNQGLAQKLVGDLGTLLPEREILLFPAIELVTFDVLAHSMDAVGQRMKVLEALGKGEQPVIVTPVEALMRRVPPYEEFRRSFWSAAMGGELSIEEVASKMAQQGYERVNTLEGPGQFAIRGGIIDVFPITMDEPVRFELFDDEVDSIRHFDVASQKSVSKLMEVSIPPVHELGILPADLVPIKERIQNDGLNLEKKLRKAKQVEAAQNLVDKVAGICEKLDQLGYFEGLDQLIDYIYPDAPTILDYLPENSVVFIEDPGRIKETVDNRVTEWAETQTSLLQQGKSLPGQNKVIAEFEEILGSIHRHPTIFITLLPKQPGFLRPENIINLTAKVVPSFMGREDLFLNDLRQWRKREYAIVIMAETDSRCQKILEITKENRLDAFYINRLDQEVKPGNIVIHQGYLSAGFEHLTPRVVFVTEKEIFGQRKKSRKKVTKDHKKIETFVADLKAGDYVVHTNHGIGKYLGVSTMDMGGIQKDYLVLQYAGEDKLYVPTDQVNLVQKYLGAEGARPKLYKLGGTEWSKVKNRVKESVQEMAQDLIELYAAREAVAGHSFSPDTIWQQEFEDSFTYEETPDQVRSIEEIKKDMERRRPMDRLLCGDVGYGKTEVAIRGAFKAVMDGKQVAVLVPTTILAQQHYNTFRERFSDYPITVEMVSRFRTAREQKEIIKRLAAGQVDVIIGTHRLVQDDVAFKDLGLIIVDEEQRFGVGHKEKLKQLKRNVDVLTLTATPIPRTLHMSLVGARDMSVLENPPEDRFPVQTYVVEYNPTVVADAITREIDRGGQVYFVHNRINDIEKLAHEIEVLVPEARIAVGHGRMREDALEQVIMDFMDGEYDVLVCTTIIETGLDIPNVNTIIINEAENMGLAQLYQLRGRVGRSNRVAYAYLTYRKDKVLTEVAEKRLQAIREFTEFGSGFKIAMRDLEIRGAGNILGPEQHGHLVSVGFDLYCRLLEDAVKDLKGETVVEQVEPSIEIEVDAYLNEEYITDQATKMEIYKKIVLADDLKEVDELEVEIEDRFGDIPQPVRNLLTIAQIRVICKQLFITHAGEHNGNLYVRFAPERHLSGDKLVLLSDKHPQLKFSAGESLEIKLRLSKQAQGDKLKALKLLLLEIKTLE